jgi:hypothetical protein
MGKVLATMLGMLVFAAVASAQAVMTVTQGSLQIGQTIEITYSDPNRKGEVITVEIDDGSRPTPTIVEVYVHLDQAGKGSVTWTVPAWRSAAFNAQGVDQITRSIACPDDGGASKAQQSTTSRAGYVAN